MLLGRLELYGISSFLSIFGKVKYGDNQKTIIFGHSIYFDQEWSNFYCWCNQWFSMDLFDGFKSLVKRSGLMAQLTGQV